MAGTRTLEQDPSLPAVDESGEQLLRHARIYTLAEKFGIEKLKSLATSKIHCVNSTAKGEVTYARYVYQYTTKDDAIVRAPIANFWATRSHALRSEAENEFRSLCLEFPEFGYDVLSKASCFLESCRPSADCMTDSSLQPAYWTRSSNGKRTKRCTRRRAVPASGPATVEYEHQIVFLPWRNRKYRPIKEESRRLYEYLSEMYASRAWACKGRYSRSEVVRLSHEQTLAVKNLGLQIFGRSGPCRGNGDNNSFIFFVIYCACVAKVSISCAWQFIKGDTYTRKSW